jgi:hypothetical protein
MSRQARDRVVRLHALKISKRTIAREWLIFLASFALGGGILIFFFAYLSTAGPELAALLKSLQ